MKKLVILLLATILFPQVMYADDNQNNLPVNVPTPPAPINSKTSDTNSNAPNVNTPNINLPPIPTPSTPNAPAIPTAPQVQLPSSTNNKQQPTINNQEQLVKSPTALVPPKPNSPKSTESQTQETPTIDKIKERVNELYSDTPQSTINEVILYKEKITRLLTERENIYNNLSDEAKEFLKKEVDLKKDISNELKENFKELINKK